MSDKPKPKLKLNPPHTFRVRKLKATPTASFIPPTEEEAERIVPPTLRLNPKKEEQVTHSQKATPDVPYSQNAPIADEDKRQRWDALYSPRVAFYIAKLSPLCTIDKTTIRWIRNPADERAAMEGMRYSEKRGQFVVDWIEHYCRLYEDSSFVKAGSPLLCEDWQYEYFMQLFGWLHRSEEHNAWLRRFTHAGIWIAKKNAKSPTLAATGLYMLIGDGEMGQKCYSVARDGKQARIAHNHAIEMVKMSPTLLSECKINHTEGLIRHVPSRSTYSVVHAGVESKSTEGFNGSLFCDETHVLSQVHMDRLKRAGISRREPLHVEVSTAGNNADDYGYNRYEYGKRIATLGEYEGRDIYQFSEEEILNKDDRDYNPHFLFMDFSIDQKVTMDKLRDRSFIDSVMSTCNPSMGRILSKREFIADWKDALQSETELRQFAMYRLNLWLKDTAAWVELSDWIACSDSPLSQELDRQYTLEDLMSYPCIAGLDLSKTLDMTALSLIFAVPDEVLGVRPYSWTWHWLPAPTVERYRRFIDLTKEDFRPWLEIINQRTIDYTSVAKRIEWVRENFDLRGLGYDIAYSSDLVRYLINDYGWNEDALIKVPQNMRVMGPTTRELERWIIRHEIHHPGNSLLSWQFQHASLDTDRFGSYRIIKPEPNDYRKVDGIVSLLIAAATLCSDHTLWTPSFSSILLFDRQQSEQQGKSDVLVPRDLQS